MENHGKRSSCVPSCYNTLRCCQKRLSGIPRRRYKRHDAQNNNDVPLNIYEGTTKCAIQADEVLQLEHIRTVYAMFRAHSLDVSPRVAYVFLNIKHAACIDVFACARAVSGGLPRTAGSLFHAVILEQHTSLLKENTSADSTVPRKSTSLGRSKHERTTKRVTSLVTRFYHTALSSRSHGPYLCNTI